MLPKGFHKEINCASWWENLYCWYFIFFQIIYKLSFIKFSQGFFCIWHDESKVIWTYDWKGDIKNRVFLEFKNIMSYIVIKFLKDDKGINSKQYNIEHTVEKKIIW